MARLSIVVFVLMSIGLELALTGPAFAPAAASLDRSKRETKTDICYLDENCDGISYCDLPDTPLFPGECKITWWFWLIIALIVCMVLSFVISCICCPCCFLFKCAKRTCNCIFCCCKD